MALLAVALWAGSSLRADPTPPAAIDFVRDIQPIFRSNCYQCHDGVKHKSGLRLDSRQTAFIGGDSGEPSIVAGDTGHGKILPLVRGDDPSAVMPPKGNRLSSVQVDLLTRWIRDGAIWPSGVDHPAAASSYWSFSPPTRPPIPVSKQSQWARNPIDAFVLTKLESRGLAPSPEADRYMLVRRVYLDLIGLPPTLAEAGAFVNDSSPDAYEKLVDRLMANPHFGERWARHWLDLARYADSAGYGSDPLRNTCFRYRDWLIEALNRNEPYDQFIVDQVAGDLRPRPTTEQLIATSFNRNTMTNTEGGTDAEEYRNEAIKDRTDTTIQVVMGLTMGCAKCHTHKYDPITNREYYQLFAFFNQSEDANRGDESPTIPTPTPQQVEQESSLNRRIAEAEAKMNDAAAWAAAQSQWEKNLPDHRPVWTALQPQSATSSGESKLEIQSDGSILAVAGKARTETYKIVAGSIPANVTALRLELLPDPSALPEQADIKRDARGGFVLNDFKVTTVPSASGPLHARYVRIELPGDEKILSLAEVEAISAGQNVARSGKASQSSTAFDAPANLAIDGITDGDFERAHSTTHTAQSHDPWWELELAAAHDLDSINIWNRTKGLEDRLNHFRVLVLDDNRKEIWSTTIDAAPKPKLTLDLHAPRTIKLTDATDSFHQIQPNDASAATVLTGDHAPATGWSVFPQISTPHSAVFQTTPAAKIPADGRLSFELKMTLLDAWSGRCRLWVTTSPRPVRAMPEDVELALPVAPEKRSDAQRAQVFAYFQLTASAMQTEREQLARLKKELVDFKPAMTAIMRDLPPDKHRTTHVLIKGNFLVTGPVVEAAVPAAFHPMPADAPPNRMGLAMWLVDPANPLTARVQVNRLWAELFGSGIVETQEDFGTQGTPPSDQPLLDWMAVEFMSRGWDMKQMIRLMVTSATYRQSSRVTPESLAADPADRLLGRFPSNRLEAELVRDQALSLSGLLSTKMLGPSVFPPQPDGLWQAAFNGERTYPTSAGEDRYRRGIYTFWRRTTPYPSMMAFDASSREVCTIRRLQTSTPLQAFVTLNDPVYVECAEALARRIIREGGTTPDQRAAFALNLCLLRPPEGAQQQRLVELYQQELKRYQADPNSANDLATATRGPLPAGVESADAAAWTVCANVLLNLDGVLTKR
jgi:mono/diheme cytochrome c family protein